MVAHNLTVSRLMERIYYDQETGIISWSSVQYKRLVGSEAGTLDHYGYRSIRIDGVQYKAHRLAWFYVYGEWPADGIDHINGNKLDNRIVNLRVADKRTNGENKRSAHTNNKSGLLGVALRSDTGKYRATIRVNGKKIYLGNYCYAQDAHNAYIEAKRKLHKGCTI